MLDRLRELDCVKGDRKRSAQRRPTDMRYLLLMAWTLAGLPSLVFAQDSACVTYVGKKVDAQPFFVAVEDYKAIEPKGTYETTAQYDARIAKFARRRLIIEKEIEDKSWIGYSADRARLIVTANSFTSSKIGWTPRFGDFRSYFLHAESDIPAADNGNFAVTIKIWELGKGGQIQMRAANGAAVTVTKRTLLHNAIFDQVPKPSRPFFKGERANDLGKTILGEIPMSPTEAQEQHPSLKLAFVVEPKAPFFVYGGRPLSQATIQQPVDIWEAFEILIANIRCGLVLKKDNTVIGAYETN